MKGLYSSVLGLALASLPLHGLATDYGQDLPSPSGPQVLTNAQGENNHWSGIGRLYLESGRQCMGSLIDTRNDHGQAVGPAYVVTAGHCVSLRNGVIVQDQPMKARIAFNYFGDTGDTRREFTTRRALWSSMQGSDLALVELDASLQQVLDLGVEPLRLGEPLTAGSAVLVVGEPTGVDTGLRLSTCTEQDLPSLIEGNWLWRNLKQNDCKGIDEGASGSPVLDRASNTVVSVVNSLTSQGVSAIPVRRLLGCFPEGRADLSQETCGLLPGFQFRQTHLDTFNSLRRLTLDDQGNLQAGTWNVSFTLDTPRYRYKAVRDPLACESPVGYSGTLASSTGLIDDPMPAEAGWHYLCVVGVESAESLSWPGLMANAVSLPVRLLEAGAVEAPKVTVERQANGDVRLSWQTLPPHITRYRAKRGSPAATDCEDLNGYGRLAQASFVFAANTLPLKVCTIAIDGLKQSSAPRTDLLLPDEG